jgi:hypothetical protein
LMQQLAPGTSPSIAATGVVLTVDNAGIGNSNRPLAVTFSAQNATLGDVLDGLVRPHRRLSWIVKYVTPVVRPDAVSVSLATPEASVAVLPDALRHDAGSLRVPVYPTLAMTLGIYAAHAHVLTGLEAVPAPPGPGPSTGQVLDLTGVPPVQAIARIVTLDSRYTWADAGGVFNVRPATEVSRNSRLDAVVPSFDLDGERIDALLDRLAAFFGDTGKSRGEGWSSRPGTVERQRQDAARQRPLTVRASGQTVREVLNSICRAEGTLSWTVIPTVNPNGTILVNLAVHSWGGWDTSRSFPVRTW